MKNNILVVKKQHWSRRQVLMGLAGVVLSGCASSLYTPTDPATLAKRKINVTTTVGMIADIAKNVGRDRVNVTALMGPGVDPHLYKPSARDVNKLTSADVIFYGGLHLEGRMVDLFEKISKSGRPAFAVTADIDPQRLRTLEEENDEHDPHVWFDVTLWMEAVKKIHKELLVLDPEHSAYYTQNVADYLQALAALHEYAKTQLASIPKAARVLVTAHDAFGYFGAAYDIEVKAIQGSSTATEAGAKDVQDLAKYLAANQIKAIFVESSVPQATVEAVQKAVRARGWEIALGGELFSDAMGDDGTPEGTYIGMVKHNVDVIVKALK
ncbi:MAG: zinc ABC transporter substrate-binding protein [Anaerolineae bacterium]|nr:zinc ABC transporter substrate-binding protein [Anaerolineae bacterium]